ncbi:MAG: hypothetical protein HY721_07655, partial [Planctomycetes bacterium]|nr:hypothetical protein [Planctomycetota bacterium]
NVRELEALLLRAMLTLSSPERISANDLEPPLGREAAPPAPIRKGLLFRRLDEWRGDLERDYISELFLELRGDVPAVARALGVRRSKLYDWCRRLGIDPRGLRKRL